MQVGGIHIGGMELCETDLPTIHACKFPCYWRAVGRRTQKPESPFYLQVYDPDMRNLYLNIIDPEEPKFRMEVFKYAFDFLDDVKGSPVAIHCNQGRSRSATIAFLYMVRIGTLSQDLPKATVEFSELYPEWRPGQGITRFVEQHWKEFLQVASQAKP